MTDLQIELTGEHCKVTYEPTGEPDTYIFTVSTDYGYRFRGAGPSGSYTGTFGRNFLTFTLNEEKTVATSNAAKVNTSKPINISAFTESYTPPKPSEPTVKNEISGTTFIKKYENGNLSITVTGENKSYYFFNAVVNYTSKSGEQKQIPLEIATTETGHTASIIINDIATDGTATVTGTYEADFIVTNKLANCSLEGLKEHYKNGDTISLTAVSNPNTEFKTAPEITYHVAPAGGIDKTVFNVSEDNHTATLTFEILNTKVLLGFGAELTGGAEPVQVIGENYGAINVYVVTLENLKQFAETRFRKGFDVTGEPAYEYIDIGDYVNRIKRIHTNVPTFSTDRIKCGNYDTGIDVLAPAKDILTLDFGNVEIPAPNGDNTDFKSEIQIFLPFVGLVNVNSSFVGKTVNLTYLVNVVTGGGVAKISYDGTPFQMEDVTPSTDVLYRTAKNQLQTIGDDNWNEQLLYGLEPYIYCKWYESATGGRNNDRQTGILGDFKGFNVFDDVTPIHTAEMLTEEQEMIYTALSDGVYIE